MSTVAWKKSSKLLYSRVSDYIREDYDQYMNFLKAYYEFRDLPQNVRYEITNFLINRDVDLTDEKWLDQFHAERAVRLPYSVRDKRILYKFIQDFYRAKGTEAATRFLFRILYDMEIDFYYPGKDIFRASHSKWYVEKNIKVVSVGPEVADYINTTLTGVDSKVSFYVLSTYYQHLNGVKVYTLLTSTSDIDDLQNNELLLGEDDNPVASVRTVNVLPGRYLTFDGHADSEKKLQDNYYYQEYSYEIQSGLPKDIYYTLLENLTHPSGTIAFSKYKNFITFSTTVPTVVLQDATITIDTFTITPVPNSWFERLLGEFIRAQFFIKISNNFCETETKYYIFPNKIDGTVRLANTEVISAYASDALSYFADWTAEDFTNTKGFIGTGTSFETDLTSNTTIKIVNNANTAQYDYPIIAGISSDFTLKVKTKSLIPSLANGSIYTT